MCYNRTDNVWLDVAWNGTVQPNILTINGISAAVSIGAYLLFGINNMPCSYSYSSLFGAAGQHKAVFWIRGGTYNRTYSLTLNDGAVLNYTTPDASVAGSAAAIQPAAIAAQLGAAAGSLGYAYTLNGAHLYVTTPSNANDVAVSDGGDGSLVRGIYMTVDSVDKLPLMAIDGQLVKVQTGPSTWFYVKAYNKRPGLSETAWREAAGVVQGELVYNIGKASISGGILYIGYTDPSNVTGLDHFPGGFGAGPAVVTSTVGDATNNPVPRWMHGQITMMTMFQDRLLIGSSAEVSVSAAGDYLNHFRSTVLTVPVSDAFQMISQEGEDDVLRTAVTYNRNLVLFGDKRQYVISGSTALTPTSANMAVMTVYPDTTDCRPVAAGGQIFYARNREGSVSVHQIQPGMFVESSESFPASAQISTYIPSPACVMETIPGAPALLVLRTRTAAQGLYVFSYIDAPDGRKQEAWFRWEFSPSCGNLLGTKHTPNGLLIFWARIVSGTLYLVADLLPISTSLSHPPYLDSMRLVSSLPAADGVASTAAGWNVAFDDTTDRYLVGGTLAGDTAALQAAYPASAPSLYAGLPFDSYVVLTNPYARDNDKKALLSGRTVVSLLRFSLRQSAGMAWELTSGGSTEAGAFSGRVLGDVLNTIGKVPVTDSIVSVPIGRETRAYSIKVMARNWFPLNLIGVEWAGQSFNRTPRA
jgi:hypothetical protein